MLEKYTFLAYMSWRPENWCPLTFCTEHEELFGTSTQVLMESLQMRLILLLAASMRIGKHSEACTANSQWQRLPFVVAKETNKSPRWATPPRSSPSGPLFNTSPSLSMDSPVSVDNLVRVLLFSKIMPKDFPCSKGKYWKSRTRIQLKWNIHFISNSKDYVSKLILYIIRKCRIINTVPKQVFRCYLKSEFKVFFFMLYTNGGREQELPQLTDT